ncbi:MAG: ribonuclease Y [Proteobacteria bacterium]|nr:ribonuclease Y [Pseudomonadota bacterium]
MSNTVISAIIGIVALILGFGVGFLLKKKSSESILMEAEESAKKIIKDASKEGENITKEAELQAKDLLLQTKAQFEKENKERRKDLQRLENRLMQKEENLEKKTDVLDKKESDIIAREKEVDQRIESTRKMEEEYKELIDKHVKKLESIANLSAEEAKEELIALMESEAKHDAAKMIKAIEEEAKETAEKKAKHLIALAIQRYSGEFVAERTVSVVNLPSDDMKGRIIGREGRNIRALEAATGIDIIVDDTPDAVILSGFNAVRREVARLSLEKLMADGRIHPTRIEEVVKKSEKEVNAIMKEAGEAATFDVGVHGIHPELIMTLGRLKYRTSYSQNVLQHSVEVAFLCGAMAAELGINQKQAKRAGLLHDLGKAIDHEVEGSHAIIGANLAKKYGESPRVVHAIAAHHEEEKPETVLACLVAAADAISAARPGVRREMMETYVKRLEDLEHIVKSFDGIEKTYAVQAGRELRIMVEHDKISDEAMVVLARDISKKVEKDLSYPGQIKINVIRETRAVEYAR